MPVKGGKQEKRPCEVCGKLVGLSGYSGHLRTHTKGNPIDMPAAAVEEPLTVMGAALKVIEAANELQRLMLLELMHHKKVA